MDDTKAQLFIDYVKEEQEYLWQDLYDAIHKAQNSIWSMGCEVALYRLVKSLRLVGSISDKKIPWTLVGGGVWAQVVQLTGLSIRDISEEEWDTVEQIMRQYGGTREVLMAQYEKTRNRMQSVFVEVMV